MEQGCVRIISATSSAFVLRKPLGLSTSGTRRLCTTARTSNSPMPCHLAVPNSTRLRECPHDGIGTGVAVRDAIQAASLQGDDVVEGITCLRRMDLRIVVCHSVVQLEWEVRIWESE